MGRVRAAPASNTPHLTETQDVSSVSHALTLRACTKTSPLYLSRHSSDLSTCCVVGCNQEVDFDPNTGAEMNYCYAHATGQIPIHTPTKPVGGAHIRQDGTLFDNSDCTMILPHIA